MNQTNLKTHLNKLVKLAIPVIIMQLAYNVLTLVDILVSGEASPAVLGAVGAGVSVSSMIVVISLGVPIALDTLVSSAVGEGDNEKTHSLIASGVVLATISSIFAVIICSIVEYNYELIGASAEITSRTKNYLSVVKWSIPPIILFAVISKFWQSHHIATPISLIIIFSNVLNYFLDKAFILGNYGFIRLEETGAAIATVTCSVANLIILMIYTYFKNRRGNIQLKLKRAHFNHVKRFIKPLFLFALPISISVGIEISSFSIVTNLCTLLGVEALAAHQVVLSIASISFMIVLGLSSAANICVGHYAGKKDYQSAKMIGNLSLILGSAIMSIAAMIFYFFPSELISQFTDSQSVAKLALSILPFAIIFQVFDGTQIIAAGIIRGLGDSKYPVKANLIGHYMIGLVVGSFTCFYLGWGLEGLWLGLCLSLIVASILFFLRWIKLINKKAASI